MDSLEQPVFSKTSFLLAVLLACLLAVPALAGATLWTVGHYMAITPADWPYPGSFWDRANDFTCILILLPSSLTCRFAYWLIFFPIPIIIEATRFRQKAVLYLFCVMLPYSYSDILFGTAFSNDALSSVLVLVLSVCAPPFLIRSWGAPVRNIYEKRLIRANLVVLWLIFCAGDVMLGLNIHHDDCKVSITRAMMK